MTCPPIVIRIHTGDDDMDWTIQRPDQISFKDTLEAINQVIPGKSIAAFDYEDEDGDRITVRSDDELTAMVFYYLSTVVESGGVGHIGIEPLVIYPRVGKAKNIHGLKVHTKKNESSVPVQESPMDQESGSGSSKKKSGDLEQILACGNITNSDLNYLGILGSGNCGTVYKAFHKPSSKPMAVKVISLDVNRDTQKHIISELEILYRCNSSSIISFFGAFFMENRISICTEFMDGGSLDMYGQIKESILGRIAVSIVRGLQYLWGLKIMHRDVKPSNVLVNTQGHIKLCDFGVSVQLEQSIAKTFIGTNAYMAPERIQGQEYRIQSEVWSLGISLFEMAVGKFPYESAKVADALPMDLLKSIVQKAPPRLPRGVFSDAFIEFVAHCMQKHPASRPAPHSLMRHPFIERFNNEDLELVSAWVKSQRQNMDLKKETNAK